MDSVKPGDMDALNVRGECKVCYDLPVRTVFVNCGHIEPTLLKELQVGTLGLRGQNSNMNAWFRTGSLFELQVGR